MLLFTASMSSLIFLVYADNAPVHTVNFYHGSYPFCAISYNAQYPQLCTGYVK